jgi:Fe-S-cluster containining protein
MTTTDEEGPWYRDGLEFRCQQCGNCCTGDPGRVWIDADELQQIADLLGMSTGAVRLHHTRLYGRRLSLTEYANGDCTFFDPETRRCRVYSARPRQCQTWPFWKSNLKSQHAWEDMQRNCPGAGAGDFYSLEDIERLASEIDI